MKVFPILLLEKEAQYLHRKAFSLGITRSAFVRSITLPRGWADELAVLEDIQGAALPKYIGRPKGGSKNKA